jgi:hypothetical protein
MSLEPAKQIGAATVQLSRRQKRDLLELGAAGVMSAIFFAAPLLLLRQPPSTASNASSGRQASAQSASIRLEHVNVVTTEVAATVSTPILRAPREAASRPARRAGPSRQSAAAVARASEHVPLGRRIVRLLAGDGTHRVQPFPTVPAPDR